MLNEWRKFVNEAEQISEEQKDPEMIAQARLDGATDYREGGSMERADKWEGGPYFEEYEDAYFTAREEEDRQDYYRDLEDDLNEGEDYYVRKMTPADGKEYFTMVMSDGNEYLVEYDTSTERSLVFDYEYAGQDISEMAEDFMRQRSWTYDQKRFPEPEENEYERDTE